MKAQGESFSYKFGWKILVAIGLGTLLAIVYFIVSLYYLIRNFSVGEPSAYTIITHVLGIVMSSVFLVLVISILFSSAYIVGDGKLIVKFGLIKTVYEYKKLKQLVWFTDNNTLAVFHDDESFTNIVIKKEDFDAFVDAMKANAPNIAFYKKEDDK